jgi:hypothetical protein
MVVAVLCTLAIQHNMAVIVCCIYNFHHKRVPYVILQFHLVDDMNAFLVINLLYLNAKLLMCTLFTTATITYTLVVDSDNCENANTAINKEINLFKTTHVNKNEYPSDLTIYANGIHIYTLFYNLHIIKR